MSKRAAAARKKRINNDMKSKTFQSGIEAGKAHFAKIMSKGKKWKNRHIPIYIREQMFIPFFITELSDEQILYVIQYPLNSNEKVGFMEYTRSKIPPD